LHSQLYMSTSFLDPTTQMMHHRHWRRGLASSRQNLVTSNMHVCNIVQQSRTSRGADVEKDST
jgi:hypothetical protein